MNEKVEWYIQGPTSEIQEEDEVWTITTNSKYEGWETDGNFNGYGLPKELAQWICDILNADGSNPPYIMDQWGSWRKNER